MARIARRLRVCAFMLLTLGLVMAPSSVLASSEGPQSGPGARQCPTIHKIALGENLTWIAAEHGVTVEALAEENGIEDANLIVENQSLCIPKAKNSRGSLNDWGSYGVPGHSYDPNLSKGQENGNAKEQNGNAGPANGAAREENGRQEEWKPANAYDVPGKAGSPGKAEEPKRDSGYWKDDLQYPRFNPDDIDPSDGEDEEPEEPVVPETPNGTGENGNGNDNNTDEG